MVLNWFSRPSWRVLNLHAILLFFALMQAANASSVGNETNLHSLLAIKDRIGGLSSWNSLLHFCQWQGITCSKRHKRVIELNLGNRSLVGSIAPHIGNLSFLRYVNLSFNNLYGEIPQEHGQLHRLKYIDMRGNAFEGNISSNISQCTNLVYIDLAANKLSGKIPEKVGSLSKLDYLNLYEKHLTGKIPLSLGNLSFLRSFNLGHNSLEGSIPETLGRLSNNLTRFSIQSNSLSGHVPLSLYNISSITIFAVAFNKLTCTLPQDLFITLPNLVGFHTSSTNISGPIPFSLANASNIKLLDLRGSNLTGRIPANLKSLKNLEYLNIGDNYLGKGEAGDLDFITSLTNSSNLRLIDLDANKFGGDIPKSISNLSSHMEILYLGGNQISGIIPEGIGGLVNLTGIGLELNQLHGSIPSSLGDIPTLQVLSLGGNKLTGSIPSSLANATQLSSLDLRSNNLEGGIHVSMGRNQHLTSLDLFSNNLNGSIPKQLFGISSLSIVLDVSHNSFTGSLPLEVGNLINLGYMDLSANMISGEIPTTLANCLHLEFLYLGNNSFEGTIPGSLRALKGLRGIDLSSNRFSGQIPKYFEDFQSLENLNLSHNELEGEVPSKGIFRNKSAILIYGNPKLCGGIPELQLQRCHNKYVKKEGNSIGFKLAIGIALLMFVLFESFLLIIYETRKKQANTISTSITGQYFVISHRTLYDATNGFSATNLIGSGSYGHVYKGVLNQDEIVAVKVFNLQQKGPAKSFMDECQSLQIIRHRNLNRILTCCDSLDHEGNDFKALVFEFMPNGSLEKWLYGDNGGEIRKLNLLQRLNIAVDVAFALEYLHHKSHVCIIHRDLNLSNVLLDNDMVVHVSDFGLAKLMSRPLENSSMEQSSSISVKEYGMVGDASTTGDVYSYEILLLELFTARSPTGTMFSDGLNIRSFVKRAMPNHVMEIVDHVLSLTEEGSEAHIVQECIAGILRIGVACSADSAGERMSMEDVSKALHHIRKCTFGLLQDGSNIDHLRGNNTPERPLHSETASIDIC